MGLVGPALGIKSLEFEEALSAVRSPAKIGHRFGREIMVGIADDNVFRFGVGDAEVARAGVVPGDVLGDAKPGQIEAAVLRFVIDG